MNGLFDNVVAAERSEDQGETGRGNDNEEDEKEKPQSDTMKDRENLKDLRKKKQLAQLQLRIARDQERVAKLNQQERKLTDAEKDKMKKYEKDISKKEFTDRYGKEEGERIYYATITKMAKENRISASFIHSR